MKADMTIVISNKKSLQKKCKDLDIILNTN